MASLEVESRSGGESEGEGDLEDVVSPQQEDVSPQQEDAPPHPARRPMNAFLIFCKRHRAQVREKYPHLENRQVTKILGEWWADLPAQQKTSYTELARQYKEAFLRANPDFKWYKIPAQPPRPPPARPSNQKVPRCDPLPTDGAITFGKLADEAQMGGLSTLLSTASTSSNSNQNIASGPPSLTTFTTAYVSAANTSTARCAPIDSFPSVAALTDVSSATGGSSNTPVNSTCGSSISTNTSVTTSLSTWSGPVQPSSVAPTISSDSNNPAISNGPKSGTGSDPAVVTTSQSIVQSESATTMTPPKPPKKRYLHANNLDQSVPVVSTQTPVLPSAEKTKVTSTEENAKSSTSWTFSQVKQKTEGGPPPTAEASDDQQRRVTNGPFSSRSFMAPPSGPPGEIKGMPQDTNTPSEGTKPPPIGCNTSVNVQPLNLTRETKRVTSNQDIINSVVDRKCSEPNFASSVRSDNQPGYPRFFRPENLHNNNNNNNDFEKPAFPQAILDEVNGTCDLTFFVSQTIDYVVDKAFTKGRKSKLTPKSNPGEKNQSAETSEKKEADGENPEDSAKESHDSSNSNNSNGSPSDNVNTMQRKRTKDKGSEESETSPKKRRDVPSGRTGRETARVIGDASGGRSRAPRKLKGKRYEELISEGVLQAPRRWSRTRNSRWEEAESSSAQDQEEDDDLQGQQGQPPQDVEEEEHDDEPMEEDDTMNQKNEEEAGDGGGRRSEDGGRRSRRQSRRLTPNDFDLEAKIEALPSLSLDDFTRRKKERKRTSSASSSSHAASHSNVHSTSYPVLHITQATQGVVSSSSRVAAQADSTSDPPPSSSTTSTATTTVTSWPPAGGVTSTSTSNGGTGGGNTSDGEAVSPTPSSSSSTSSVTQQHSPTQGTLLVAGGSLSPGESGGHEGGPRIGSQKRKARKQAITRHDPVHGPHRRDTSVVEPGVLSSISGLAALAEVAFNQPSMKL